MSQHQAVSEIGACNVYRLDPSTGHTTVVAEDFVRPNGLAFSPDETRLYIVDTRQKHIRCFAVDGGQPQRRRGLRHLRRGVV